MSAGAMAVTLAADAHLITRSGIGAVQLGMTLQQARAALPHASFVRTTDGDGAALVEITLAPGEAVIAWAGEDDPSTPIDWSARIASIETFGAAFHTIDGIHPGSRVADAVRVYGAVTEIQKGEIEQREFVMFGRQPPGLTFRIDYTGVFDAGSRTTTRFAPEAQIYSISVSRH